MVKERNDSSLFKIGTFYQCEGECKKCWRHQIEDKGIVLLYIIMEALIQVCPILSTKGCNGVATGFSSNQAPDYLEQRSAATLAFVDKIGQGTSKL